MYITHSRIIFSIVENIPPAVLDGTSHKLQEDAEMADDDAMLMGGHTIPDGEIKSVITSLSEIIKVITLAPHLIVSSEFYLKEIWRNYFTIL